MRAITNMKQSYSRYLALDSKDKKTFWKEAVINNAIYFLLLIVVIYTTVKNPNFIKAPSIVNIISLSAANLPIACGIAGCIVLTGTDLSAGRVVGFCIPFAVFKLCIQNVPGTSGTSYSGSYPCSYCCRWYCRSGKRLLRS